jgi:thymidylate synthase ThyX
MAKELQAWLASRGVDAMTARKQARGAARGYLGNALYTDMVFSASVAQWRRMLRLRCCDPADAEIRVLAAAALPGLKASRHGDRFASFDTAPAKDGLGLVAVEARP